MVEGDPWRKVGDVDEPEGECPSGKVRYPNQLSANGALLRIWKARTAGNAKRRERWTYRCPHCGGYHLTHWSPEEWAARVKERES